jgi:hypothetical protein
MTLWPSFFEDSDLIVKKLRLLHGKGVNSGTPGITISSFLSPKQLYAEK